MEATQQLFDSFYQVLALLLPILMMTFHHSGRYCPKHFYYQRKSSLRINFQLVFHFKSFKINLHPSSHLLELAQAYWHYRIETLIHLNPPKNQ